MEFTFEAIFMVHGMSQQSDGTFFPSFSTMQNEKFIFGFFRRRLERRGGKSIMLYSKLQGSSSPLPNSNLSGSAPPPDCLGQTPGPDGVRYPRG
jgi:hypothetical protein